MELTEDKFLAGNFDNVRKYAPMEAIPIAIVADRGVNFGPKSQPLKCPHCNCEIATKLKTKATTRTHMYALLLFCLLCWPCCCIPYCVQSCKNTNHFCPNCDAFLGTYES